MSFWFVPRIGIALAFAAILIGGTIAHAHPARTGLWIAVFGFVTLLVVEIVELFSRHVKVVRR